MSGETFRKVGRSAQSLYGPRAMLVCGFQPAEQERLSALILDAGLENLPVVFASADDGGALLLDLLRRPHMSGAGCDPGRSRAVVLSGITEDELHKILFAYRGCGMPRPLWATLTPVSENWRLEDLLTELEAERRAIESRHP